MPTPTITPTRAISPRPFSCPAIRTKFIAETFLPRASCVLSLSKEKPYLAPTRRARSVMASVGGAAFRPSASHSQVSHTQYDGEEHLSGG